MRNFIKDSQSSIDQCIFIMKKNKLKDFILSLVFAFIVFLIAKVSTTAALVFMAFCISSLYFKDMVLFDISQEQNNSLENMINKLDEDLIILEKSLETGLENINNNIILVDQKTEDIESMKDVIKSNVFHINKLRETIKNIS